MKKYLKEVDVLVSNLFLEKKDQFRKESCCFLYLLNDLLKRKVSSSFEKIAVKLWPVGQLQGEGAERHIPDLISGVLLIEKEYDINEYYRHDELRERNNEILRLLEEVIYNVPSEYLVDKSSLSKVIAKVKESDGVYRKEIGRWVSNPGMSLSAKLWVEYNSDSILFGVKVIGKFAGKEHKKVFAEFDVFNTPVLCELGRIEFSDDKTIKYSPKNIFQEIYFRV